MSKIDHQASFALRHDRLGHLVQGADMPLQHLKLIDDQHRYTMEELLQLRRQMLRFARSLPPGPERNARRQIELSLRSLFKNKAWLEEHTIDG